VRRQAERDAALDSLLQEILGIQSADWSAHSKFAALGFSLKFQ